jgi:glycosyl transferase family 25
VQIFVINLPEDVDRRRAVEGQLRNLGLHFEVLPAIGGTLLSSKDRRNNYDELRFVRNEGRSALPGELGCALSHIEAYRLVVERKLPYALILEDDAWMNPNVPQLLKAIERQYPPSEENVFLFTWFNALGSRQLGQLWSSYHVADVKSAFCTHGYVVSNAAAEALAKALHPVRHLADCWKWLRRHRVVRVLSVVPTCITADLSYATRTSGELAEAVAGRSWVWFLRHKLHRVFWRLVDHGSVLFSRRGKAS